MSLKLERSGPGAYVSPQIETMLGFSAAEWMSDPEAWVSCVHPEDRDRVLVRKNKVWSTESHFVPNTE